MNKLFSRFLNYLRRFVQDGKLRFQNDVSGPGLSNNTLSQVNKGLKEMKRLYWEFKMNLQTVENQLQAIQRASNLAWSEREQLLLSYYDTLRSILTVLDNCENLLKSTPQISTLYGGLKSIMKDQCIEPIQVKEGDSFDPELHICEETVKREGHPTSVVIRVIETGYLKKLNDGTRVVIRPAKVIASASKKEIRDV